MLSMLIASAIAVAPQASMFGLAEPPIKSQSAIIIDADSGQVLWGKNEHVQRFPASTTKIMTALLLAEHTKPEDIIRAPNDVQNVKEASLNLRPGERVSSEGMMYALMIRSGNDAAYAVAVHIAGSQAKFSELMNARAKECGARNTRFNNPHGLNDPVHITTAYDLAMIAKEAMKNERVRQAAAAKTYTVTRSVNQQDTLLKTKNRFLDVAGSEGIKTGYTNPAGHCFVGAKSVNGWRLITVVLKSEDWFKDTCTLFDWAYANFERKSVGERGEEITEAAVVGGVKNTVPGRLGRSLTYVTSRGDEARSPGILMQELRAPISEGQAIGRFVVELDDGTRHEAPILAAATVPASFGGKYGSWPLAIVAGLAVLITFFVRKPRKRIHRRTSNA
ncbi:MAG: D-alanyl-D-alanine carboxypeptidase [Fimbriimonadales bacterium]|nr:D-alanyl-D-alanine carboxypeptidase [Fimbriimonadales bacterium]